MEYVPLYSPGDLGESAFIESLLKSGGIRYYIHGEISTRVYPQLSLNQRVVYVHPADFKSAYGMLQDFIGGRVEELPDFEFDDDEPQEPDGVATGEPDEEHFPYWFLFLLAVYILYKVAKH